MLAPEKLKKEFNIALASAGIRQADFARRCKISSAALSQVLSGKTKSKKLSVTIDQFISAQFEKLRLSTGRAA